MKNATVFRCVSCLHEHELSESLYVCPKCGGNLDLLYDYAKVKSQLNKNSLAENKRMDIWRYAPLLPVDDIKNVTPLAVGWSPLYHAESLGKKYGLNNVYIKDDGRNPSASFKDRASAAALVRAVETGSDIVIAASTGNAGCSMACLSASIDMPAVIFVPKSAPQAKIAQLLIFGAEVVAVEGTYDDAFDLCLNVTSEFGWYNRNTGFNPYTREGKKTCAFEICEQMNWEAPDYILVSVGDGNIISGFWKGLRDLKEIGLIEKMPRLIAVQSDKSNAVALTVEKLKKNGIKVKHNEPFPAEMETVQATTIADSISVDDPRDGISAVRAVMETGGDAVQVSDQEILNAVRICGAQCGVFAEPSAAAVVAGLKNMAVSGKFNENDKIVCLISGNGLKDVPAAMKVAGSPHIINPDLNEFKKLKLRDSGL